MHALQNHLQTETKTLIEVIRINELIITLEIYPQEAGIDYNVFRFAHIKFQSRLTKPEELRAIYNTRYYKVNWPILQQYYL